MRLNPKSDGGWRDGLNKTLSRPQQLNVMCGSLQSHRTQSVQASLRSFAPRMVKQSYVMIRPGSQFPNAAEGHPARDAQARSLEHGCGYTANVLENPLH